MSQSLTPRSGRKYDEIIDATYRLLQRNGYSNTSIAAIKKDTGASASSIYWMFENKDNLISTSLEAQYPVRTIAEDWSSFSPEIPLIEQLRRLLGSVLESEQRGRAVRTGLLLALEGSAQELPVQEPYRRRRADALRAFREWWRSALVASQSIGDVDVEQAATRMSALTQWFLDGHFIGDIYLKDEDTEARLELMAQTMLAAATSPFISAPEAESTGLAADEAATPADLLEHVRVLVAQRGYEGATFNQICSAAGVARSSIYWKYEDKDALIKDAFVGPYLEMKGELDGLPDSSQVGIAEALAHELVAMNERLAASPLVAAGGLLIAAQRRTPPTPAGRALVAGSRASEKRLAGWLETTDLSAEVNPTHAAWLFNRLRIGMVAGVALQDNALRISESMVVGAIQQLRAHYAAF
ncbi:TetR/AcrR family transcriptional regulator [Corynebacterium sp. HMSC074A01]|uniref:TetR/AcrR family transcriptional regulator n=1 Tax=Corynebacterium sp. HMSC074A01 TaxID=1715030 RepID=UPI0008A4060E|nr:TetR/AcrR family transcriptional regulator [Corynebacterium sp. HMSC074A01]OHF35715.1 hypothetical protein HMPREF2550_11665 [Corynebacterium sp. HMSC074A01]